MFVRSIVTYFVFEAAKSIPSDFTPENNKIVNNIIIVYLKSLFNRLYFIKI